MANILSIILLSAAVLVPNNVNNFLDDGPGDPHIVVTGDSYAVNFFLDELGINSLLECSARPGHTVEENKEIMLSASDRICRFILVSVGVNDQDKNTHPSIFKSHLRDIFDKAKKRKRIVFVHTYENAPNAFIKGAKFQALDYDTVLRELANEYDNVIYIDMSDCSSDNYFLDDGYHVNEEFNDILYKRMMKNINEILEKEKNDKRKINKS